jgi:hypothetical protein
MADQAEIALGAFGSADYYCCRHIRIRSREPKFQREG